MKEAAGTLLPLPPAGTNPLGLHDGGPPVGPQDAPASPPPGTSRLLLHGRGPRVGPQDAPASPARTSRLRWDPHAARLIAVLGVLGGLLLYPAILPGLLSLGITMVLFAAMATAWDVLGGWTGQLSLGHAAFVGIGAYTMALLFLRAGLAPWWGTLAGVLASLVVAAVWGWITFRLRGPYFVLASIAVAEMIRMTANNAAKLTGGAEGVSFSALPRFFGLDLFSRRVEFYLAVALLGLALLVVWWLSGSRLGYRLRAIREDPDAATAMGIDLTRTKIAAFLLSAALTSLGGSLYGIFLGFFEPRGMFSLDLSIQLVLMAYIGGAGTVFGPVVGAALLVGGSEALRIYFPGKSLFVYGVLIVLVVLFAPNGLTAAWRRWHRG